MSCNLYSALNDIVVPLSLPAPSGLHKTPLEQLNYFHALLSSLIAVLTKYL